jgi:hypothetical protein
MTAWMLPTLSNTLCHTLCHTHTAPSTHPPRRCCCCPRSPGRQLSLHVHATAAHPHPGPGPRPHSAQHPAPSTQPNTQHRPIRQPALAGMLCPAPAPLRGTALPLLINPTCRRAFSSIRYPSPHHTVDTPSCTAASASPDGTHGSPIAPPRRHVRPSIPLCCELGDALLVCIRPAPLSMCWPISPASHYIVPTSRTQ